MILYLIRHGIADPASEAEGEADTQRSLTPKGRKRLRQIARALKAFKPPIEVILTSPYLRAAQTAQILSKQLGLDDAKIVTTPALAPGGDAARLIEEVAMRAGSASAVALVGHEPGLSRLISVLISGKPDLAIVMKKGGVCRLAAESPSYGSCAALEWLMAPAQLRRIGG